MTKNNNKIIIIGAGLAGLTLANSLKRQGISFEVYERDESVSSRTQGWTINIHMALNALRQSMPEGSLENFSKQVGAVPGSESIAFKFINANTGDPFLSFDNHNRPGTAYRVSRYKFRQWLLQPVQDHVHWNKRLIRYEENEDSVTAFFDDGTQVTGDLLVGTDGTQSPVACQLLGGQEQFNELTHTLNVRLFGTTRTIPKELWNTIANNHPQFFFTALGTLKEDDNDKVKGNSLVMFCSVQNYEENASQVEVHWGLSRYDGENVIPKFTDDNTNEVCLNMLKSWACRGLPEDSFYRKLVTETPNDTKVIPIFIRERVPTFESLVAPKRKVFLVGDAAHPMSMYKGEGGNHAMIDAHNLSKEIGQYNSNLKTLDEAIESYYNEMVPRGEKAIKESHEAAMAIHTQLPEVVTQMYVKIAKEAQVGLQENNHQSTKNENA